MFMTKILIRHRSFELLEEAIPRYELVGDEYLLVSNAEVCCFWQKAYRSEIVTCRSAGPSGRQAQSHNCPMAN